MKDVWKSARVEDGVLCVMTTGMIVMPVLSADSWDSQASVCNRKYCSIIISICITYVLLNLLSRKAVVRIFAIWYDFTMLVGKYKQDCFYIVGTPWH